jgi:hypothetical protein
MAKSEDQGSREKSTIEQLQKIVNGMTQQERDRLSGLGINIPQGDVTAALQNKFKFGVRCTECNKVALFFVGEEWTMPNGEVVDIPPPLPHNQILWSQTLPPHQIDRVSPKCQNCGVPVALEASGSFRRDRNRIIRIEQFEQSRDASYDRKRLQDFKREVATGGAGQVELPSNYDKGREPVSRVIERQRGDGSLQELEFIAKATGLDEALRTGLK